MTDIRDQMVSFVSDPNNFLFSMDLQKGLFKFVATTRSELSALSFLDYRTLGQNKKKDVIPAPQIIQALHSAKFHQKSNRANYLFHSSFCCSTLVARCLDLPGKNLSLKEPHALLGLAAFKRLSANFDPADPNWKNLRDITLYLLSRSFHKGEKILFKPSNGANNLLPEILDCPQTERVLILYDDLESFLISILHGGSERAASIAHILEDLVRDFADNLPLELEQIRPLTGLQKIALGWGLQMQFLRHTIVLDSGQKVKSLKSATFLRNPEETLEKLSDFYDLKFSRREQAEILNGPTFNMHSKDPRIIFSRSKQIKEKENILNIFGEDIRETITWARSLGLDFESGLSNPL